MKAQEIQKKAQQDFQIKKAKPAWKYDKTLTDSQKDALDALANGKGVIKVETKKEGKNIHVSIYNSNGNTDIYKLDNYGYIIQLDHDDK